MKKILFVYPHDFLETNMGTNLRVNTVARKLKERDCEIDLFAFTNFCSSFEDFDARNSEGLISELFLYNHKKIRKHSKDKSDKKPSLVDKIRFLMQASGDKGDIAVKSDKLDNWVIPDLMEAFNEIILKKQYDCVVMFYVYTAELLLSESLSPDVRKVYFMEDFLSVGHFVTGKCEDLGGMLNEEVARISLFDNVFCISWDEKLFFEKLLPETSFSFLPHLISSKPNPKSYQKLKQILFIGHGNEYNIAGVRWFLTHVYGLLDANIRVKIVGKVSETVTEVYDNVECVNYVEDLAGLYLDTDIVICPLKNGTGMKIKVIEAMSYGIPVVCTSRGVDGFPDKTHSGCVLAESPEDFAGAINKLVSDCAYYDTVVKQTKHYFETKLDAVIYEHELNRILHQ